MENNAYIQRFEAYLTDALPPDERRAFEQELSENTELRTAFRPFQLAEKAVELNGERQIRHILQGIRAETGVLPKPRLTIWEELSLFFSTPKALLVVVPMLAIVAVLFWANTQVPSAESLAETYFMPPANLSVAGAQEEAAANRRIFQRASDFYWAVANGGLDSLEHLAEKNTLNTVDEGNPNAIGKGGHFNMAHYYVAHWHLKNQSFAAAKADFAQTLANAATLKTYRETQDLGKIKLNLLLSELALAPNPSSLLPQLDGFLTDADCRGDVRRAAESLKAELERPLRKLKF